jgi:tryptophan synthase alpha chain
LNLLRCLRFFSFDSIENSISALNFITMERISNAFTNARIANRACFIPYVCACDPDLETSVRICHELINAGIDILEIGVPFSDPLADGLTNQLAAQRALESGATHDQVFDLVKRIREMNSDVPIILYTYFNLVYSQGLGEYADRAKDAGVDGFLTLDLPPEEAKEFLEVCKDRELANVFIVAPTTPDDRISLIAETGTGFLYYVSREGVTGAREEVVAGLGDAVKRIKDRTKLPVVVGFGISSPEQVREVASVADGVVVGSAIVNCIPENLYNSDSIPAKISSKVQNLMTGLLK